MFLLESVHLERELGLSNTDSHDLFTTDLIITAMLRAMFNQRHLTSAETAPPCTSSQYFSNAPIKVLLAMLSDSARPNVAQLQNVLRPQEKLSWLSKSGHIQEDVWPAPRKCLHSMVQYSAVRQQ